jgi:hypothetical protein
MEMTQRITEITNHLLPDQYGYVWACQLVRNGAIPSLMQSHFYPNMRSINGLAIKVHYYTDGSIECIAPDGYAVLQNTFTPPPFGTTLVNWVTFKGRRYAQIPLIYQSQEFYQR